MLNLIEEIKYLTARALVDRNGRRCYEQGALDVEEALKLLYREPEISLKQLAATFRRGDLLEKLN
jgi:hypothetical protein